MSDLTRSTVWCWPAARVAAWVRTRRCSQKRRQDPARQTWSLCWRPLRGARFRFHALRTRQEEPERRQLHADHRPLLRTWVLSQASLSAMDELSRMSTGSLSPATCRTSTRRTIRFLLDQRSDARHRSRPIVRAVTTFRSRCARFTVSGSDARSCANSSLPALHLSPEDADPLGYPATPDATESGVRSTM